MRKVIVNSTPIIALCKVDLLHLLKDLYGEITIPEAVYHEVTAKNDRVKDQLINSDWISIEKVTNLARKRMYHAKLHEGEVEVMLLAQDYENHLVVIDDGAARNAAIFLGLKLTGTIGVLIKAKQQGFISAVMPIIHKMETHGIYFSDKLKETVRHITSE